MARTALGTQKVANAASGTLTGIALNAGDTICVLIAVSGAVGGVPTGVTWNGQALTQAVASQQLNTSTTAAIYYKKVTGGATGSVVVSLDVADDFAFTVSKYNNLVDSPLDKTATTDDISGTAADSGSTATTAQADEELVGVVATNGPTTDTAPTWLNSFSAGQRDGNFGGDNVTVNEGYRTVSSTGAYKAAATLATARDWAAAIATFKVATGQTSTPSSIDVSAVANNATGVPGPVTSSPASLNASAIANAATGLAGARVLTPASLAIAVTPALASGQGGGLGVVHGARLPEVVTAQNPIVIRPTSPANLGDGDATTYTSGTVVPPNPAGGTVSVTATAIADPLIPPGQTISHLRFRALCWVSEFHETDMGYSNFRMGWTVGANSAEAAVTNEDPNVPADTVIGRDVDGLDPGDHVGPGYYVSTGNITTKPGGGAWTPADVNALTNVALKYDYAAGVGYAEMYVGEILIEVYGAVGSPSKEVRIPQNMGRLVRHQRLDTVAGGE